MGRLLQTKISGNVSLHKVEQKKIPHVSSPNHSAHRVSKANAPAEPSAENQHVVQETTNSCLAMILWPPAHSTPPARATQRLLQPTLAGWSPMKLEVYLEVTAILRKQQFGQDK